MGLGGIRSLSLNGLDALKRCTSVYLEGYTSPSKSTHTEIEQVVGRTVKIAERLFVEEGGVLLREAKEKDVALLVVGDVFSATTHFSLYLQAQKEGIEVHVLPNASVLTAVGITGLSLYKFGKTASIPFERRNLRSPYETLKENGSAHTLFLLDLDPQHQKFLSIPDAIEYLLQFKKEGLFIEDSLCVACEDLGGKNKITVGTAKELKDGSFAAFPQCLIVPGTLHFTEEEALSLYRKKTI